MNALLQQLTDKDDKRAYERTKAVAAASEESPIYYPYIGDFASLLTDKSSYIRTRAFILCCCQARWDTEGKLAAVFPAMLALLHDEKPTVVRQCLNALKEVAVFRPELSYEIRNELKSMDLTGYKDTMRPLIEKDRKELEELLNEAGR